MDFTASFRQSENLSTYVLLYFDTSFSIFPLDASIVIDNKEFNTLAGKRIIVIARGPTLEITLALASIGALIKVVPARDNDSFANSFLWFYGSIL